MYIPVALEDDKDDDDLTNQRSTNENIVINEERSRILDN